MGVGIPCYPPYLAIIWCLTRIWPTLWSLTRIWYTRILWILSGCVSLGRIVSTAIFGSSFRLVLIDWFYTDFYVLSPLFSTRIFYVFSLPGFILSTRIFYDIPTRFFYQDSTSTKVLSTRIFYDIPTRFFYQDSTSTKVLIYLRIFYICE